MKHFMKDRSFKNSIRLFSLLFCLPIILISIVIKIYFNGPIQNNYISQHNDAVMQEVDYLNQQLGQIEVLVSSQGQNFTTEFSLNPIEGLGSFEKIGELSQNLFFLKNSSSLIKDVQILVFDQTDAFIIAEGGTQIISDEAAFDKYKRTNGKTYQWQTIDENQTVFVQDISGIVANGTAYLVTTLNKDKLLSLLEVSATDEGAVALKIDGKKVVSSGKVFADDVLPSFSGDTFAWQDKIDYIKYSFVATRMSRLSQEWFFYSASPISRITEPINHFSNILFLIGFLMFVISLILGQILAKRTYQPVDNLMTRIIGDREITPDINEFNYLITRWQDIVNQNNELEIKSHSAQAKLKQSVLSHMLEGKYSYLNEKELQQLIVKNGWKTQINSYQLVYIRLTAEIEENPEDVVNTSEVFMLGNLAHDLALRFFSDFTEVEYLDDGVVLFVANTELGAMQEFSENIFTFVNEIIKKYVVINISLEEKLLSRLSYWLHEVEGLCHYQKIIAANQVVKAREKHTLSDYNYPDHIAQKIVGDFRRLEAKDIDADLTALTQLVLPPGVEMGVAINVFGKLYDQISYVLAAKHVPEANYISKDSLLKKISRQVSVAQINQIFMTTYLFPGMALIKESQHTSTEDAVEKAIVFIKGDYQNPNLSLEETADYVGLEVSYLSREFKRLTKVNFIDFLTDFRLDKAKDLLANSTMKINDIAEAVGYNSSYFNRLFKKKFLITPGQYRKKFNRDQEVD